MNWDINKDMDSETFKQWALENKVGLVESHGGLKVGDNVTYTNEFGVSFKNHTILGIADDSYNFYNRRFFLSKTAWWFPVLRSELTPTNLDAYLDFISSKEQARKFLLEEGLNPDELVAEGIRRAKEIQEQLKTSNP